MINTTLCYIEKDNKYLMLHRNKKEHDLNEGKWIGVGGKIKDSETPEECIIREVFEETGLHIKNYKYRGLVTFINTKHKSEYIFVYTTTAFTGELKECNEGTLQWVSKDELLDLTIWEGDKFFLQKILDNNKQPFSIKLIYDGDTLVSKEEF
ncbi:MAG TPA: 8-oxo-dGTP diphosphatase [Treponemataceae bacterium]|nr:8-oxo-dGTP diphosphatase [Treponemataceae bacterium]